MSQSARVETALLISFADLTHYRVNSARTPEAELAALVDGYYELVGEQIGAAGGRVVKFIGDAAMIVFAEDEADAGVRALLELKRAVDEFFARRGWDSRLVVKVHFGRAIAGPYGARGDKRFDVIGNAVNLAATVQSRSFALSAEAFQRTTAATRALFKEHTPQRCYIPVDDPDRS